MTDAATAFTGVLEVPVPRGGGDEPENYRCAIEASLQGLNSTYAMVVGWRDRDSMLFCELIECANFPDCSLLAMRSGEGAKLTHFLLKSEAPALYYTGLSQDITYMAIMEQGAGHPISGEEYEISKEDGEGMRYVSLKSGREIEELKAAGGIYIGETGNREETKKAFWSATVIAAIGIMGGLVGAVIVVVIIVAVRR